MPPKNAPLSHHIISLHNTIEDCDDYKMFLERMEQKNNPQPAIVESDKKQEEEKKEAEN
jgi:hypothetical protein